MIATRDSDAGVVSAPLLPKLPVTVDTKGRVRVSREQRRDILAALTRSGESIPRFAERTGLRYSTLARWVQHARRTKRPRHQPQVRLLEAVVASEPPDLVLQVQLPGGARLEIRESGQVPLAAALLRALEKSC